MVGHEAGQRQGQEVANLLQSFIGPLEQWLDRQIDRRLVRTFFLALVAIVRLRHSRSGLLLSEWAPTSSLRPRPRRGPSVSAICCAPPSGPTLSLMSSSGTGRISRFPHLEQRDELALAIWDESVLEKPESIAPGGIVPGPLQQGGPPQAHQTRLLQSTGRATSVRTRPVVAHRDAGRDAGASRPSRHALVDQPGAHWPATAGNRPHPCSLNAPSGGKDGWSTSSTGDSPALPGSGNWADINCGSSCAGPPATIWPMTKASVPPGTITRGKRSQDHREIWDSSRRQYRKTGIVAVPVRHPQFDDALWLVVSRPGKGQGKPWYLLTNETIETPDDAWRVVPAYAGTGRWRCATAPARRTWPWRAPGCGSGKTVSSCC